MRIIDMRPEITPWEDGQSRKVGKWSYVDYYQSIGGHCRDIYHYDTLMLTFVGFEREFDAERGEMTLEWQAFPVSIGHGSVSDQGGINQLLSFTTKWERARDFEGEWQSAGCKVYESYGYYMLRDQCGGGPRIINQNTGEAVS